MTIEEKALNTMKRLTKAYCSNQPVNSINDLLNEDFSESSSFIINAVLKQTPTKPDMRHMPPYDDYYDGECPNCSRSFYFSTDEDSLDDAYCKYCGQKLNLTNND